MVYYNMKKYNLIEFKISKRKNKMYDAILQNKETKKIIEIPFGDKRYENYRDITGLKTYNNLIHGDKERRKRFRARHKGYLKTGYYSPSYFSYNYLW